MAFTLKTIFQNHRNKKLAEFNALPEDERNAQLAQVAAKTAAQVAQAEAARVLKAERQRVDSTVVQSADAAGGHFLRFLDILDKSGVVVQPRWTSHKKTGFAPMHSFHLEPLWFGSATARPQPVQGLDWPWLLSRLDYPQAAKERLRALVLPDALSWCDQEHAQKLAKGCSAGETQVRGALEWMYGQTFQNVRPDWFVPPGYLHKYELDGYCEPLGLAFEFQGPYHSDHNDSLALQERMRLDAWKRYLVTERGIFLIEVDYRDLPEKASRDDAVKLVMAKLFANRIGREFLAKMTDPQAIALRDSSGFQL